MIDIETLRRGAARWKVELDETALSRFDAYAALLLEWNQKINLTAIKEPDGIIAKHFIDSLALLSFFSPTEGAKVIDVGLVGCGCPLNRFRNAPGALSYRLKGRLQVLPV